MVDLLHFLSIVHCWAKSMRTVNKMIWVAVVLVVKSMSLGDMVCTHVLSITLVDGSYNCRTLGNKATQNSAKGRPGRCTELDAKRNLKDQAALS